MIEAAAQTDMFVQNPDLLPRRPVSYIPTPDQIRERLREMMDEVRVFRDRLPWTAQELFVAKTVFHNMANWLPEEEREPARAGYLAELARFKAPD